ncbi:MAG: type II secretion system F family protein [Candidatus Aenigmatarchaeota archaeon]
MRKIYETFGEIVPYTDSLEDILNYAGLYETSALRFSGFMLLYSIAVGITSFSLSFILFGPLLSIPIGIIGFVGFQGLVYIILVLTADSRAGTVEEILPDALLLMAANIRAGMSMDRAIWLSARPEFGPLEEEIKRVGRKVFSGTTMEKALLDMNTRIKSDIMDRAVRLITEGIKSGGEMAHLLEETASDIRNSQAMQKEVKSNVMMYSMFIIFASVLGSPLLFSISLYFVETTNELWGAQMSGSQKGFEKMGGFIKMEGPQITVGELQLFSIACILLTTVSGSLLIGLIQNGESKTGLKYAPIMAGGGLAVFFISKFLVSSIFGAFVGF